MYGYRSGCLVLVRRGSERIMTDFLPSSFLGVAYLDWGPTDLEVKRLADFVGVLSMGENGLIFDLYVTMSCSKLFMLDMYLGVMLSNYSNIGSFFLPVFSP